MDLDKTDFDKTREASLLILDTVREFASQLVTEIDQLAERNYEDHRLFALASDTSAALLRWLNAHEVLSQQAAQLRAEARTRVSR